MPNPTSIGTPAPHGADSEVGRLATLVPAFTRFPGPLALLEVGSSAGLCLYPDRWGYRWTTDSGDVVLGACLCGCRVHLLFGGEHQVGGSDSVFFTACSARTGPGGHS